MPRVKWIAQKAHPKTPIEPIKQDYVSMMFGEYMRKREITYRKLGEAIGKSPDSLKVKKHYGSGKFKLDDLIEWGIALDVDEEAFTNAIARTYREAMAEQNKGA